MDREALLGSRQGAFLLSSSASTHPQGMTGRRDPRQDLGCERVLIQMRLLRDTLGKHSKPPPALYVRGSVGWWSSLFFWGRSERSSFIAYCCLPSIHNISTLKKKVIFKRCLFILGMLSQWLRSVNCWSAWWAVPYSFKESRGGY